MVSASGWRRGSRGLTLVEVLLAIVVVLIGVTAAVALLSHAAASEERARQILITSAACQDLLAKMEDAPFDEVTTSNPAWSETAVEAYLEGERIWEPEVTIEIEPYGGANHLKRILVRVDYSSGNSSRHVEFETLLADELANMKN